MQHPHYYTCVMYCVMTLMQYDVVILLYHLNDNMAQFNHRTSFDV